jgi:hypothetical protein
MLASITHTRCWPCINPSEYNRGGSPIFPVASFHAREGAANMSHLGRRSAFTLVELLVFIGIILPLIASSRLQ